MCVRRLIINIVICIIMFRIVCFVMLFLFVHGYLIIRIMCFGIIMIRISMCRRLNFSIIVRRMFRCTLIMHLLVIRIISIRIIRVITGSYYSSSY